MSITSELMLGTHSDSRQNSVAGLLLQLGDPASAHGQKLCIVIGVLATRKDAGGHLEHSAVRLEQRSTKRHCYVTVHYLSETALNK